MVSKKVRELWLETLRFVNDYMMCPLEKVEHYERHYQVIISFVLVLGYRLCIISISIYYFFEDFFFMKI